MKMKLKIQGTADLIVADIEWSSLIEAIRAVVAEPKPECMAQDSHQFHEQMEAMNVAYAIMQSYPDGYFESMTDGRIDMLHSSFMEQLLRYDRRPRDAAGDILRDSSGNPIRHDRWYWEIDANNRCVACGQFRMTADDGVVFVVGDKPHKPAPENKYKWAITP